MNILYQRSTADDSPFCTLHLSSDPSSQPLQHKDIANLLLVLSRTSRSPLVDFILRLVGTRSSRVNSLVLRLLRLILCLRSLFFNLLFARRRLRTAADKTDQESNDSDSADAERTEDFRDGFDGLLWIALRDFDEKVEFFLGVEDWVVHEVEVARALGLVVGLGLVFLLFS